MRRWLMVRLAYWLAKRDPWLAMKAGCYMLAHEVVYEHAAEWPKHQHTHEQLNDLAEGLANEMAEAATGDSPTDAEMDIRFTLEREHDLAEEASN